MGYVHSLRDFASPHEGRTRTVRIYTPDAYDASPDRSFPVLSMQNGQNVFAHPESALFDTWCTNLSLSYADPERDWQRRLPEAMRWLPG